MQNKTPIVVLTGLGIVAAAAVAGLTRDQWMSHKTEVAAVAPAPETKTPDQPAASTEAQKPAEQPAPAAEAQKPAEQPAAAAEAQKPADQPSTTAGATPPAAEPAKTDTSQQQAAVTPPASQPEQPAAGNAAAPAKVPAFDTVRVEKTGEAVIAGTAAPGADVVVKLDGKVIGQATANGDGAFVVVPEAPLPAGSAALTLEARSKDAAAAVASQQSVAVIVPAADQPQEALVAVVSPDQPTRVLQKPEVKQDKQATAPAKPAERPAKLVSIDAVDYDANGNIVFSGQGDAGNTARVYIDNNFIGDAPVGTDGRWSFSGTAQVTPGVHTLRVDGLDGEGKVVNRVEVPFVREEQKKVADSTQPAQTTPPAQTTEPEQPAPATPPAQTDTSTKTDAQTTTQQPAATTQPPAAAAPAKPKDGRIVIQPGNNLWRISRVLYGTGAKFTTLYEANKDQIRDPDRIYPGQVFKTPDVAPTVESIDPKRRDQLKPEENGASGQ